MSTFAHVQEAKKRIPLPQAESVGVCLTCTYWDAETPREPNGLIHQDARCVQPELKPYALLVSGASGCNKWQAAPNAGDAAHQYAETGAQA